MAGAQLARGCSGFLSLTQDLYLPLYEVQFYRFSHTFDPYLILVSLRLFPHFLHASAIGGGKVTLD